MRIDKNRVQSVWINYSSFIESVITRLSLKSDLSPNVIMLQDAISPVTICVKAYDKLLTLSLGATLLFSNPRNKAFTVAPKAEADTKPFNAHLFNPALLNIHTMNIPFNVFNPKVIHAPNNCPARFLAYLRLFTQTPAAVVQYDRLEIPCLTD